jgi:hypothetical protein
MPDTPTPTLTWMDTVDELCARNGVLNVLTAVQLYCAAQGLGADAGDHWMPRAAAIEAARQQVRKDGKP